MRRLAFAMVLTLAASTARGELITAQFEGSGGGAFAGLGTSSATYTESIQLAHHLTGTLLDFDMTVTLAGANGLSSGSVRQDNGIGLWVGNVFDAAKDVAAEETLQLTVSFAPVTGGTIQTFQFNQIDHGLAQVLARATDETNTVDLTTGGGNGPTGMGTLSGQSVTILTQALVSGFLTSGSVDGIESLSFDVTAAPEPSAFALCGLISIGSVRIRRRRKQR